MQYELSGLLRRAEAYSRTRGSERGVETVEWIGMAAVVVALMVGVAAYLSGGGGTEIGKAIVGALKGFISQLTGG